MSKKNKKKSTLSTAKGFRAPAKSAGATSLGQPLRLDSQETLSALQGTVESEEVYRAMIKNGTAGRTAYGNLAAIYGRQGRFGDVVTLLRDALELWPDYPEAHNNLGVALKALGHYDSAIASYEKALELRPCYPDACNNLGNAFMAQGRVEEAIERFNGAIMHNPGYEQAYSNLAIALNEKGDVDASIQSCLKALEINPKYPDAYFNLGVGLYQKGDITASVAAYRKAIAINPSFAKARWNLSLAMFLDGDYENGWVYYEWRNGESLGGFKGLHARPPCSLWNGCMADLAKQILLVCEQGLGDSLQFMRYVTALRSNGVEVSLCAPPKLHSLIRASGIDPAPLTPDQASHVAQGQWLPLLSLPRHLKVGPANPGVEPPYLKGCDNLNLKWERTLSLERKPVIGINWQGNPHAEKGGLRGRSLLLDHFSSVAAIEGLVLLSLQKGAGSEQLDGCSFRSRFASCQKEVDEIWDFLETASIVANCDLVITSDTCVAHLAGGMGKETWLLLHSVPDWRWGLDGDTTFWYPSMRLFRQREPGDWNRVMQDVSRALADRFHAVLS